MDDEKCPQCGGKLSILADEDPDAEAWYFCYEFRQCDACKVYVVWEERDQKFVIGGPL